MSQTKEPSTGNEIVIALYRPHPGKAADLEELVRRHVPTLRAQGLISDRAAVVMRGQDGTIVEVFEWLPGGAAKAHHDPEVGKVWGAMGEVADFVTLSELPEASQRFCHFTPV